MEKFTRPLLIVMALLTFACNQQNEVAPQEDSIQLSEIISDNLSSIADGLRASQQTFSNTELVERLGRENLEITYGSDSDAINSYSNAFSSRNLQNARIEEQTVLSNEANEFLNQIVESANSSEHLKAYKNTLDVIDQSIINSELSDDEKTILRVQVISLQTSLTFVAENFDLFHPEAITDGRVSKEKEPVSEEDESWWDSWGKCAAGIVGGAGTEALAGCGIGAAAGLGIASIPGCGVGAIAGGIFGGLTGAAIFC